MPNMIAQENQIIVIFGASGDLTARKLIPSIYNLYRKGFLPTNYAILGVGRSSFSDEEFRDKVVFNNSHLDSSDTPLEGFADLIHYESINTAEEEDYISLRDRINAIGSKT